MCDGKFRLKAAAASALTEKINNKYLSESLIFLLCTSPQYFHQFIRTLFKVSVDLFFFLISLF